MGVVGDMKNICEKKIGEQLYDHTVAPEAFVGTNCEAFSSATKGISRSMLLSALKLFNRYHLCCAPPGNTYTA